MENVAAYIDGYNLYHGLKERNYQKYYWLDIPKLIQNELKDNQQLSLVYYFTSPSPKHDSRIRQITYVDALKTNSLTNQILFKVIWGRFVPDEIRCNNCGDLAICPKCDQKLSYYHEKETDVNISVQVITDAYEEKFDTAYLLTADSDQVGTINIIKQLWYSHKKVGVLYPPGRHSNDLNKVADFKRHISPSALAKFQLPETVTLSNGYVLKRPDSWS